jgi:hypothetical protein
MFQHHLMMDRAGDEIDVNAPTPQPHPNDPVSCTARCIPLRQRKKLILIDLLCDRCMGTDAMVDEMC